MSQLLRSTCLVVFVSLFALACGSKKDAQGKPGATKASNVMDPTSRLKANTAGMTKAEKEAIQGAQKSLGGE